MSERVYNRPPQTNYNDEAALITKVYSDLGVFDAAEKERAPEMLAPAIAALHEAHPGTQFEPFVVVNHLVLGSLIRGFDGIKSGHRKDTHVRPHPWNRYPQKELNRRTYNGREPIEPENGWLVMGHILSEPESDSGEYGLTGLGQSLHEQRRYLGGTALVGVKDYFGLQALRQEKGEPPLDAHTATRFPQYPEKPLSGEFAVGHVGWHKARHPRGRDQLRLLGSDGRADRFIGYRRSLGPKDIAASVAR